MKTSGSSGALPRGRAPVLPCAPRHAGLPTLPVPPEKSVRAGLTGFGVLVSLPLACTLGLHPGTGLHGRIPADRPSGSCGNVLVSFRNAIGQLETQRGTSNRELVVMCSALGPGCLILLLLRWRMSAKAPHWPPPEPDTNGTSADSLKPEGSVLGGGLAVPRSGKCAPAPLIIRCQIKNIEITHPSWNDRPGQQSVPRGSRTGYHCG